MAAVLLPQEDALCLPTHCILLSPLTNLPCSADKVCFMPAGKSRNITWTLIFLPTTEGRMPASASLLPGRASSQRRRHPSSRQRPAPPHALIPPSAFSRWSLRQSPALSLHCPHFPPSWDTPSRPQMPLVTVLPPHRQQFVLSKSPVTSRRRPNLRHVSHLLPYQKVQLL